jgi:hypothetical protein
MGMWFEWFQTNYWIAAWLTEFQTGALEVFIAYMVWSFMGHLSRKQKANLSRKLADLATPTAADKAREEL